MAVVSFLAFDIGRMVVNIVQDAKDNRNSCKDSFTNEPRFAALQQPVH
ncbi:MAG: hypothetical protein FD135_5172 [Comamonadaceae bacterium]|nr:MAG: hypothetical protein FD135_5172 [Comamonadaceae bacterium]